MALWKADLALAVAVRLLSRNSGTTGSGPALKRGRCGFACCGETAIGDAGDAGVLSGGVLSALLAEGWIILCGSVNVLLLLGCGGTVVLPVSIFL